jgi:tetratricopeptide (TPR) repeat protein
MPLLCQKNYRQMFKRALIIATIFLSFISANAQPPKNAQIVYHQGLACMGKGQYPDAMGSFFKALALYKNYDSAYFQMANINVKFDSNDTAISFYKKALAINPKYLQALINVAVLYKNVKQNFELALDYYLKAVAIDSTNKETQVAIAWCYNTLKDYDKAIVYSVKALAIDNNYKIAYGELGNAYHMSGKFADAIVQFKKNIAISPSELPIYYCGRCYIELKDKAGAISMYNELLKISPKFADELKKRIDKMEN